MVYAPNGAELGHSVALIKGFLSLPCKRGVFCFSWTQQAFKHSQSFNAAPVAAFTHFAVDLALLWEDNPRH